jgi:hypothetical protein
VRRQDPERARLRRVAGGEPRLDDERAAVAAAEAEGERLGRRARETHERRRRDDGGERREQQAGIAERQAHPPNIGAAAAGLHP